MIIKSNEHNKINLDINKFILLYGKNDWLKNQFLEKLIDKNIDKIINYEEKEVLENKESVLENLLSKSFFENKKILHIKRATDKIVNFIEELNSKSIEEILIIINAGSLEKRSKLRSSFEKNKPYICVAFYPDNTQTLTTVAYNFFKTKNISISTSNINLIVNKSSESREALLNELEKIECFCRGNKKITLENILALTNILENFSISDLIDNSLAKNKKKVIAILNENNFSSEDGILIIRGFLNKSKKLLKLSEENQKNQDINLTISSARPPIFWKDKEITKLQLSKWAPKDIKQLIYKVSEIELLIKKNINNSIKLITDFILNQSSANINN